MNIKKIILFFLFNIFLINIFATTISPDYESKGLGLLGSFSYNNVFNSDNKIFTIDIIEVSLFPQSYIFTAHWGIMTQFSADINIFDVYVNVGFTLYPFKKIVSLSGNFGFNYSIILLNHFSYISDIKLNFDIPTYKKLNITFGIGLRNRDAIRIFDYMNLSDNYYKEYNSYFLKLVIELYFRIFIIDCINIAIT